MNLINEKFPTTLTSSSHYSKFEYEVSDTVHVLRDPRTKMINARIWQIFGRSNMYVLLLSLLLRRVVYIAIFQLNI